LSSAMVSIDPAMIAGASAALPPRPQRPATTLTPDHPSFTAASAPAKVAPSPRDLEVEVTRDGAGHRVLVRRKGHLVAIEYGVVRRGGKGFAAVHVELADKGEGGELAPLIWETTPLHALTTERGLVSLRKDGDELKADLALSAPPERTLAASGPHH